MFSLDNAGGLARSTPATVWRGLIEGLDVTHAAPATTRKVAKVPCAQPGELFMELPCQGDILVFQRPHLDR